MTHNKRHIIKVLAKDKKSKLNYQRRMYAILRRYTPEVSEGLPNVCYAELTGLRTFFKMSYEEMTARILKDLKNELGVSLAISLATEKDFMSGKRSTKRAKSVSTYSEINDLFKGAHFVPKEERTGLTLKRKVKLTVPFIGKIS